MFSKIKNYIKASDMEKARKRRELLNKEAEALANEYYNIERIKDRDYITYKGVIVSTNQDSDNVCERLNYYRKCYVERCTELGTIL